MEQELGELFLSNQIMENNNNWNQEDNEEYEEREDKNNCIENIE